MNFTDRKINPMKSVLSQLFRAAWKTPPQPMKLRDNANLDVVLPWALAKAGKPPKFPAAYVEFLRSCLESKTFPIITVKHDRGGGDTESAKRFASLLGALANLPPTEFALAEELAQIADSYLGNPSPVESGNWTGDVRAHFEMSSSFGHKGRILATIIRFMRCRHCLELGTAYGMSALFMLEALSAHGPDTRLTTVEGSEPQYRIASGLLGNRYPGRVDCEYGWTSQVLPRLAKTLGPVAFMFHDAGHSRKDYVSDFQAALPLLAPGAVVLFDDISWNDPRFAAGNPECHKGWLEVAGHARVRWAVEIGRDMGLVLLG